MKLKLIAAAIAMAASAQASAAIMTPDGTGAGEAFFNIWDPTTNNSYTQDLGVTFSTFLTNMNNAAYSLSFGLDTAVYNTALGSSNSANLIWNVSVGEKLANDFSNVTDFGIIGTSKNTFTLNYAALDQAIAKHGQVATAVKSTATGAGDANTADNLAYHGTIANGAYTGATSLWGSNWGGSPVNNTAGIGEDMGFYYEQGAPDFAIVTEAAGRWAFDGSTITYGAVPSVPVPAAVWLFGSGLIGLVGVARRKKA